MALPLPGASSTTWARATDKMSSLLTDGRMRVWAAFFVLGLINNVLYVIILSAALDLVGPSVPKATVLLADIIPSFLAKLVCPYFIKVVPYPTRVVCLAALSAIGMLVIALPRGDGSGVGSVGGQAAEATIGTGMAGIVLASTSSGAGELSFLGLTHFYGPLALAAWGSGTGAAGLVGAGAYALATNALGWPARTALLASSFLPVLMLLAFFVVLPKRSFMAATAPPPPPPQLGATAEIEAEQARTPSNASADDEDDLPGGIGDAASLREDESLLLHSQTSTKVSRDRSTRSRMWADVLRGFRANLRRSRSLFFPYMLPLFLVYIAEYVINQGVAPTLLFPLQDTPFEHYRAFYPAYNAIYQAGVFISRSSTPFFRIHNLYLPSLLQVGNLALLIAQALVVWIPSVYLVFAIIFWEGLLGGLVYVNTFAEILDTVSPEDREFSLGATSVSDSAGVCVAGLIGMVLEVRLCKFQVEHGRDYCRKL